MATTLRAHVLSIGIIAIWPVLSNAAPPMSDWERSSTKPSKYTKLAKAHQDAGRLHLRFKLARDYTGADLEPVSFELETVKATGRQWTQWFREGIEPVLIDNGILHRYSSRSGSRTIERSREFDLKEYEYREREEREGGDDETFVIARVLTGVSHSADFENTNLVYYAIRRLLVRQLAAHDGPFDDVPVEVGDACYHLGNDAFGFIRGNVIVEIAITPGWREDGKLNFGRVDTAWREKLVEAAKRIDAMLMEKMFDEETRTRIRAAENKRTPGRHPVDSPRSRDNLNPESRRAP